RREGLQEILRGPQVVRARREPILAAFDQGRVEARKRGERLPQPGELARTGAAKRDARRDALDVRPSREYLREPWMAQTRRGVRERLDRRVARGERARIAQRMVQPMAKPPRAHGGRRAV